MLAEKHCLYAGAVEKEGQQCGRRARAASSHIGLSYRMERVEARQFRYASINSGGRGRSKYVAVQTDSEDVHRSALQYRQKVASKRPL